ncbi:MAG TPA: hypothetical protein PLE52_02240 [Paludibacteraceae bacterium]|nr:hypothetical protein [Paludibacteraceae bacterium]
MNLIDHYNELYKDAVQKIQSDDYELDELIDSHTDNRFGITLLARPDKNVKKKIQKFLEKLKQIEPEQYYYPTSDIHVTIMSIITCYNGFNLHQINIQEYIDLIQKSINGFSKFNIEFKGITASPSCVMIQGFPQNNNLTQIRNNLRNNFKNSNLQQSIDKRYKIQAAHSTVFRFKKRLNDKETFLKTIEQFRDYNFGSFSVDTLELVFNDWYQRKKQVKTLYRFKLE